MSSAYLIQYGHSAFVGRFAAAEELSLARGDRVVVRTPRGVEIGDVLCEAAERFAGQLDPSAGGDLLRRASADEETHAAEREEFGRALLLAAEASDLPLTFLDVEVMLDGSAAVFHVLPRAACDADPLFAELSARFGLPVWMLDISRQPVTKDPPTGCGKPDCGSGGCSTGGCSTGGCSRGSVKSADELTAYFADLRQKMEQHGLGRTPLH